MEHNNTEALRFWIRVFELEAQIAFAHAKFHEQSAAAFAAGDIEHDPKLAMVPIISEYNAGHIKWIYVVLIELDIVGICGGTGIIYYADKANEEDAYKRRDKFADAVMKSAQERMTRIYLTMPGTQK